MNTAPAIVCPKCKTGPCAAAMRKRVASDTRSDTYAFTPWPGGCPYMSGALSPHDELPEQRREIPEPLLPPPHRMQWGGGTGPRVVVAAQAVIAATRVGPRAADASSVQKWHPRRGFVAAISLRQPWAWAVLAAGKDVENREWRSAPEYRGVLLIHAAAEMTTAEYEDGAAFIRSCGREPPASKDLTRGALVGAVELVGAERNDAGPGASPWALPMCLGLRLARPQAFARPEAWEGLPYLFEEPEPVASDLRGRAGVANAKAELNRVSQAIARPVAAGRK